WEIHRRLTPPWGPGRPIRWVIAAPIRWRGRRPDRRKPMTKTTRRSANAKGPLPRRDRPAPVRTADSCHGRPPTWEPYGIITRTRWWIGPISGSGLSLTALGAIPAETSPPAWLQRHWKGYRRTYRRATSWPR